MLNDLENFYLNQPEPNKSCLLALREVILALDENIADAWKYRMPFFYYKNKMFCYLWIDKQTKEPYIGIAKGSEFTHPLLEQGGRSRIKILRIQPDQDLPINDIQVILREAMTFY
ncbi:DUF1801 domain-containing protein [Microscilla marina]|uniref:YdhG-like domain-containing protein n=1 Tax=Microscilla marina ATCC 23134 TaxID=313606 RepID=A1ZHE8_MICM2|nr:DUF1801 domain-containing protein [Microscilla marina]EAY30417.1 hypothetical protein M23134_08246 [Microscilla marina ATCC 23134]